MVRGGEIPPHKLPGAFLAVRSFCNDREDLTVHLMMDNSAAIAYVNHLGGTRSSALCSLVIDLWAWWLKRRIFLIASHLPGTQNTIANSLSRSVVDTHDWVLHKTVFKKLNSLWGPILVDLFATKISKQLPRYFSWKPNPHAEAIDAFAQVWTDFRGFANPPVVLNREMYPAHQETEGVNHPDNHFGHLNHGLLHFPLFV